MTSLPRFSVNNPILVNLLMVLIFVGGGYSAFALVREMFPESRPNSVSIMTVYPGATPAEVEKGIAKRIEEEVKDIDGVDEVHTSIGEGFCRILVELQNDVDDLNRAVNDVKAAVDAIPRDELPRDAEETTVSKFEPTLPVISVAAFGDHTDAELKRIGRRLRDELLLIDGITNVDLNGARKDEISIEIRPDKLTEYGLSFMDVAGAVRGANLDLPGGRLKLAGADVAVRTLGEEDRAEKIVEMIIRSDPTGKVIRVSDVATVIDGLEDVDVLSRFNGQPAVDVMVTKTPSQDAIEISRKVKAFIAGKTGQPLVTDWLVDLRRRLGLGSPLHEIYEQARSDPYPTDVSFQVHSNLARFIEGRLDLLTRNGTFGLVLVFCSLFLFLNWRVALWVMIGLLLSILGTLIVMKGTGQSLNLISMFGLIVVLGMLVDDAIVVGENVYRHVEEGMPPTQAAIVGAEQVTWPVTVAILTTIVAFVPLFFVSGQMGDFMKVLPMVVISSLTISLCEALIILPSHLGEWLKPMRPVRSGNGRGVLARMRDQARTWQHAWLTEGMNRVYTRVLKLAVRNRYVTFSVSVALLTVAVATALTGHVPFVFLQKMDSETLIANLKMPVGTPIGRTDVAISEIEKTLLDLPEMNNAYSLIGASIDFDGGPSSFSSHVGQVIAELETVEIREAQQQRDSDSIVRHLRAATADLGGIDSLEFKTMSGGPVGAALHLDITGERLDAIRGAAEWVKARLNEYDGVKDITDDFDQGRREMKIRLRDSARSLGLTTESLATQVRAAFYGLEVRKVQRDREDVRIMVRYPEADRRNLYKIEQMRIATPDGAMVPFREVASVEEGTGYVTIHRRDQQRKVTVTADVEEGKANAEMIASQLQAQFPEIQRTFPGVGLRFGGQQRETTRSFASLIPGFGAAVLMIFMVLVALFRSYVQPIIVMTAIPFGFVGAVVGHWFMGFPLTIMSGIGLVALTGIVVNDSLILVDFINHRIRDGRPVFDAVIEGGQRRLRPIVLTSVTTVLGLGPLLLEKSFQARFLIPMGVSIAFGLMFATVLTLVLVPSLYMIAHDAKAVWWACKAWITAPSPRVASRGNP